MKNRFFTRFFCLLIIIALMVTPAAGAADTALTDDATLTPEQRLDILLESYKKYHLDKPDEGDLLKSLFLELAGSDPELFAELADIMLNSYDKYNHYMEEGDYMSSYYPPEYYGIGVVVAMQNGYITITRLLDGSARKAGMEVGDRITAVDGKSVAGLSVAETGELIKGEKDTALSVTVLRGAKTVTFDLTRAPVYNDDLTYKIIDRNIGYISVDNFDNFSVYIKFREALASFRIKGATRVIIDLRGNRGGAVNVGLNMLDEIIPDENLVMATFNNFDSEIPYKALSTGEGRKIPALVVLTDENSASTSEVFAGVVQDLNLGVVIGKTTLGKGRGQHHIRMIDGSWLIVTTSEVFLPKQQMYDGIGITPDIEVDNKMVPIAVPTPLLVEYSSQESRKNIMGAEQRLNILGFYDVPSFNGDITEKFTASLGAFQRSIGLEVTGKINPATLRALDDALLEYMKITVPEDSQLKAAIAYLSSK